MKKKKQKKQNKLEYVERKEVRRELLQSLFAFFYCTTSKDGNHFLKNMYQYVIIDYLGNGTDEVNVCELVALKFGVSKLGIELLVDERREGREQVERVEL